MEHAQVFDWDNFLATDIEKDEAEPLDFVEEDEPEPLDFVEEGEPEPLDFVEESEAEPVEFVEKGETDPHDFGLATHMEGDVARSVAVIETPSPPEEP